MQRGLEKLGALSGALYTNGSAASLFVERLKADGDTVIFIRLSDSTHGTLGPEGMKFAGACMPTLDDSLLPSVGGSTPSCVSM
jgi:hypothetical protein